MAYDKNKKENDIYIAHPNQVAAFKRLEKAAEELHCTVEDVRYEWTKRLTNQFYNQYKESADYKKAQELDMLETLMSFVKEQVYVQAQAVCYANFPKYTAEGEEQKYNFGFDVDMAPHLDKGWEIKNYATTTFKEAKERASIEINLPSVLKKKLGYPEHSGSNNLSANRGDDFL